MARFTCMQLNKLCIFLSVTLNMLFVYAFVCGSFEERWMECIEIANWYIITYTYIVYVCVYSICTLHVVPYNVFLYSPHLWGSWSCTPASCLSAASHDLLTPNLSKYIDKQTNRQTDQQTNIWVCLWVY